jgi:hypothetical protein
MSGKRGPRPHVRSRDDVPEWVYLGRADYQRAMRNGEKPSEEALAANRWYTHNIQGRGYQRATQRALSKLKRLYPDDFRRLFAEELEALKNDPPGGLCRGRSREAVES